MIWLASIVRGIVEALIGSFRNDIGKTKGVDAKQDTPMLTSAGNRIRGWMQSRGVGKRGKPDEDRP